MTYAAEIGSGAMIYEYTPSFIETGSGIQKLMGRGDTQIYRHTDSMEIA
jgi:hypothetical protein